MKMIMKEWGRGGGGMGRGVEVGGGGGGGGGGGAGRGGGGGGNQQGGERQEDVDGGDTRVVSHPVARAGLRLRICTYVCIKVFAYVEGDT